MTSGDWGQLRDGLLTADDRRGTFEAAAADVTARVRLSEGSTSSPTSNGASFGPARSASSCSSIACCAGASLRGPRTGQSNRRTDTGQSRNSCLKKVKLRTHTEMCPC